MTRKTKKPTRKGRGRSLGLSTGAAVGAGAGRAKTQKPKKDKRGFLPQGKGKDARTGRAASKWVPEDRGTTIVHQPHRKKKTLTQRLKGSSSSRGFTSTRKTRKKPKRTSGGK